MGQRIIITESERMHIQQMYGIRTTIMEQSDGLNKEDLLQKIMSLFDMGPKTLKSVKGFINSNFNKMSNKTLLAALMPILINMSSCQSSGGDTENCDEITDIKINDELWDSYKQYDFNNDSIVDYSEQTASVHYDTNSDGKLDDTELQSIPPSYFNITDEDKLQNSINNSGVDIIKVSVTHNEYSSQWDNIRIKFKNNSNKTITAIQFLWFDLKDAFGETITNPTHSGGNSDNLVKPNQTTEVEFETYEDQVVSAKVYVNKIMFSDGTKWVNEIERNR